MDKICSKCKLSKELTLENFATRKDRDGWQSLCRLCQKIYRKEHYELHKAKYLKKAKDYRISFRREFYTWLAQQSCVDCGISDIRVFHFDHQYDKLFNVSKIIGLCSHKLLWDEIAKCEIVCANCHAIRTAKQFNYYWYLDITD